MDAKPAGHVEFHSTDPERTKQFLGGLFELRFKQEPDGSILFGAPGYTGSIMRVKKVPSDVAPRLHITVPEIAPYLTRAEALGGRVLVRRREIPKLGHFAKVADPDGNVIELIEPLKKPGPAR
ncbi:MAG TPA: VOC family protein [Thermoplasmata archaeon]|nr:VOC family protein [Thermoplasmata archaeon]